MSPSQKEPSHYFSNRRPFFFPPSWYSLSINLAIAFYDGWEDDARAMKALLFLLLCVGQLFAAPFSSCTGNTDTEGCRSFKEMAEKNDADIISKIISPSHAFACFPPGTDRFYLASYTLPNAAQFKHDPNTGVYSANGYIQLDVYENGELETSQFPVGIWTANKQVIAGAAYIRGEIFIARSESRAYGFLSGAEININYSYPNIAGGTTSHSVKIRRSTMRFLDTTQATSKDPKEKTISYESTGYCTEFP